MYKTSTDLRFVKNREALERAYLDLVKEKGTAAVTVTEIAARARVNRMTFYAHYETVNDILYEFVDGMVAEILAVREGREPLELAGLFEVATAVMSREIDLFRLVAKGEGFELFRGRFREGFKRIFEEGLGCADEPAESERRLAADMFASGVTYAYLDWLAGEYGMLSQDELARRLQSVLEKLAV